MRRLETHMGSRLVTFLLLGASFAGCRGQTSEEPPVHWQRNMFTQDKARAQRENDFFADHRSMRPQVLGTVSATTPVDNDRFYQGKDEAGVFIKDFPVALTRDLLLRGQDRFNIYCAPCHSRTGTDPGIVVQ